MIQTIKRHLRRTPLPRWYGSFRWGVLAPVLWKFRRAREEQREREIVERQFGGSLEVLAGPFAGLKYVSESVIGGLARLFGTYEAELHGVVEEVVEKGYPAIINIGSGEGYYAIGLARRLPDARVYAFDMDPAEQRQCQRMVEANGVADRVSIAGACSIDELAALPLRGCLLVCDCEGAEFELLQPGLVPALRAADILVELHDWLVPGTTAAIVERFRDTHDIRLIDTQPRDPDAYPQLRGLNPAERRLVVDERRPPWMQWAYLRARASEVSLD